MAEDIAPRQNFAERYRKPLLGALAVAIFFAAWQAIFLVVPFNPLFISKPSLIFAGYADLIESGMEQTIVNKTVTYDFERLMEGATKVKTSEFGDRIIENMQAATLAPR